jgi:hypothetical protein
VIFTSRRSYRLDLKSRPLKHPLTFPLNQPSCMHNQPSISFLDQIIVTPVQMCFPCRTYKDVYFEERPKPKRVNKHPHTGTVYAGYYVQSPMVPMPLPGVVIPPPVVPTSRLRVPALLPVGPTISLRYDSSSTSFSLRQFASFAALQNQFRLLESLIHFLLRLAQLHKRNSHFFDFFSPQHSPKTTQSRVTYGPVHCPLSVCTFPALPRTQTPHSASALARATPAGDQQSASSLP